MEPWASLCLCENMESLEDFLKHALGLSGQKIKGSQFSKKELQRQLVSRQEITLPLELLNWREVCPTPHKEIAVITETPEWVALHKPPGVHTHPHGYEIQPNLIGWLAAQEQFAPLVHVNSENYDRGALWRLDLETSGVVVVAKSSEFYHRVRDSFSSLVKRKYYLAIVEGTPPKGSLTHRLGASEKKGRKMVQDPRGQEASLVVTPLLQEGIHTVVLVELNQGMRHQIRAQLSLAGCPILGDTLYGGAEASRLFLHSYRYEFLEHVVRDQRMELFGDVVDLHRLLQVLSDMGL